MLEGSLQAPRPSVTTSRVVLVVDDEPDILESTKDVMEALLPGVHVLAHASGHDALDCLAQEHVDLIISDYKMPGMDGLQLLTECRRRVPNIPRIMMTAYATDQLADRARDEADVAAFLVKAGDPDRFLRAVTKLLAIA